MFKLFLFAAILAFAVAFAAASPAPAPAPAPEPVPAPAPGAFLASRGYSPYVATAPISYASTYYNPQPYGAFNLNYNRNPFYY